jgi:hypothetical protein
MNENKKYNKSKFLNPSFTGNLFTVDSQELSSISLYNNQKDNLTDIIIYLNKFRYKLVTITQSKYLDNKLLLLDAYFKKY